MNGVPFRFRRQKNSTWIPAKLVWLSTIQPGQNWANLKSQNYKNVSSLWTGFASFTSERYIYLLKLCGQIEFLQNFVRLILWAADLLGRAAEISDLLNPRNRIFKNNRVFLRARPARLSGPFRAKRLFFVPTQAKAWAALSWPFGPSASPLGHASL